MSLFERWIDLPGASSGELSLVEQGQYYKLRDKILNTTHAISAESAIEKIVWLLVRAQRTNNLFKKSDRTQITDSMRENEDNILAARIQKHYETLISKKSALETIETFGNITLRNKFRYPGSMTLEEATQAYAQAIKQHDTVNIKKTIKSYIQYAPTATVEKLITQYIDPKQAFTDETFTDIPEEESASEDMDIDALRHEVQQILKSSTEKFTPSDQALFNKFIQAGEFQMSGMGSPISKAVGGTANVKVLQKIIAAYKNQGQKIPHFLAAFD